MNRFFTFLIICLAALGARAELVVTHLDWDELRIDTLLPQYSEVVPLESDYRHNTYRAAVSYPEWAPLTARETAAVRPFDEMISDTLTVVTHVGVSRRQGTLDISFVPIVRREGRYLKLLSGKIDIIATPMPRRAQARRADTRTSRLATGRWVKISIPADGMYRLTRSALVKMGFTKPDNVRLYGYGGHLESEVLDMDAYYDDLQEVPLYKTDADTWVFWGNGLVYWKNSTRVINPYARAACYFLTEADAPATVPREASLTSAPQQTYTTFTDHVLYEKDEFAWFSGGRNLYEAQDYATTNVHTYKLQTTDSEGGERLTICFTAGNETPTQLQPTVNGTALKQQTLPALGSYVYGTTSLATSDVSSMRVGSDWTVKLATTAGQKAHLDYLALHYTRSLRVPAAGYLAFTQTGKGAAAFDITCTPSQTHVLRLPTPSTPLAEIEGTATGGKLRITVPDATARYVAFDATRAATFPQPTLVGEVENQNLHALDSLDMVIVIPASAKWQSEAERLAEAHRQYDGLRTAVVRADHIYNEYSSGTPDATAYRLLMKQLYDRCPDFRYLILMGDCAWDNRMLSSAWRQSSPDDYLLCFESENSLSDTKCFVMEDYFGLLDEGEGASLTNDKVDLGIGRFPVTSLAEARTMVDKCITYMSGENAGAWRNVMQILGDDGDDNEHMKYADDVAERIMTANPELEVRKTMWDAYRRVSTTTNNTYPEVTTLIHQDMTDGVMMMNYTGHGATYCLSHEQVLRLEDFQAFEGTRLPLWVTAACDVMPFDGQAANIGETAVLSTKGAALAFYGTTRTVYAYNNLQMNRYFCQYLFARDDRGRRLRLGDAIRMAKTMLIANRAEVSNQENKLHYALLGDPALVIGLPEDGGIVLDSINGHAVAEGDSLMLSAGQVVTLRGHVANIPNGTLTARLYDSFNTITCHNNAGDASKPFTFRSRDNILYNGQDSIVGGQFNVSFVVPADINFSSASGRVVFYALSDTTHIEANGYCERFRIGGTALNADTIGPKITPYFGNDSFENGGTVCATPHLLAQLEDESGINFSGNGVGHDLVITVDNDPATTYTVNDAYAPAFGDYRRGTLAYTLPRLPEGKHSLTLRAWDVLGNTSQASLDFWVNPTLRPNILSVAASDNPARQTTTFLISYDMPGAECDFQLDLFDYSGRRLWSHTAHTATPEGILRIPYGLTTGQGGRLWPGIYLYRVTVAQGGSKKVSKTQKLIVANR